MTVRPLLLKCDVFGITHLTRILYWWETLRMWVTPCLGPVSRVLHLTPDTQVSAPPSLS